MNLSVDGLVAAATVLPKFTLFKFWAPPHRFAWFGCETLEPLRRFSFSFTLKMDFSLFIYALFSSGLSRGFLVYWSKKRKYLFFTVAFSEKERT